MAEWICGIAECEIHFGTIEGLLRHQIKEHPHVSCKVCGEEIPDGIFAIHHVIGVHRRVKYMLAYGANSNDIRYREHIKKLAELEIDIDAIYESLMGEWEEEIDGLLKDS